MKKKYFTEEERKAAQRENGRRYRETHKDKIAAKNAGYYQRNKEYFAEYQAEYYQNNKEKKAEYQAEYYQNNKEKKAEYNAEYRQANKEKIAEKKDEYRSTPFGRANYLLDNYKRADKKYNRGECTLTVDWIVERIFTESCHYCGKTDYHDLGCDRIDNSLPHTPDNVVPCCAECNKKRGTTPYDEFIKRIGEEWNGEKKG